MAVRHDFTCNTCGHAGTYWAYASAPPTHCGAPMTWTPRPGSFAIDAKESFEESTVESGGRTFKVDSLHAMRKIERETEQMARNKEGQPLVWRDYSQDHSNFDVHTLSKTPHKPMDGYDLSDGQGGKVAEKDHGVDLQVRPEKFSKRVGDDVTRAHGKVADGGL